MKVSVGPQSVANELFTRGQSFGGDTLTTTDVAMVAGVCPPLPSATPPQLEPRVVYAVMQEIHRKLELLVEAVKVKETAVFGPLEHWVAISREAVGEGCCAPRVLAHLLTSPFPAD